MIKRDIATAEDIQLLVDSFYARIREDELLGHIFKDVAQVAWPIHLPRMYAFWETVLLNKAGYKGNPVLKHVGLAQMTTLTDKHFSHWVALWEATVDQLFQGDKAIVAKERALIMSKIMAYKCAQVSPDTMTARN